MDFGITPAAPIRLRVATLNDAEAIVDIWRKGLTVSLGFEAELPEAESYFCQCIQEQSDTSKFWVATDYVGKVLGWQSLRPTRANPISEIWLPNRARMLIPVVGFEVLVRL